MLKLGADWRRASADLFEITYNGGTGALTGYRRAGGRNDDIGLYAENDWRLGRLVLTAGARADWTSINDGHVSQQNALGVATSGQSFANRPQSAISGRGGALWQMHDALALRASAYTGLRQPTVNELYRQFVVTSPGVGSAPPTSITTQANAALTNESLAGYEAGVDFTAWQDVPSGVKRGWLKLSLTAFYNRLDHAIANVTINSTTRQRQNVDAIRARGVEMGANFSRGPVFLNASLAWTDAVVIASGSGAALNGLRPAQTPKLAASATLGWQRADGLMLSATLRHVGTQYEDDLQTYVLPAATTLAAIAKIPLGGGALLVLRGENLTDAVVETRNQAGSIDVNAPRTVWIGVQVKR